MGLMNFISFKKVFMYKGIIFSVISSCLFATQYYLAARVSGMNGGEIFGWRTIISLPFMTLFLILSGEWKAIREISIRIKKNPLLLPGLILSSFLMALQQWLFIWAPLNGRGLNVSLGYFLLPLVMLSVGYLLYRETLSGLKKLAGLLAAIGICHELYMARAFSWEALTVSIGMTAYFILRKALLTENLGGLWFDMVLMIPSALWFILTPDYSHVKINLSGDYIIVALIGIISAAAFMFYITASRYLSFSLFGLMGYVEPVLLVIVSLILKESLKASEWLTYIPIWIAVILLICDGIILLKNKTSRK